MTLEGVSHSGNLIIYYDHGVANEDDDDTVDDDYDKEEDNLVFVDFDEEIVG